MLSKVRQTPRLLALIILIGIAAIAAVIISVNKRSFKEEVLRRLVEAVNSGQAKEPLIPVHTSRESEIIGVGTFDHSLPGDLDVLSDADLLSFRYNGHGNKIYTIKQSGYDAVENNFVAPQANPAFAELTGYSVEEAIGRKPKELVRSGLQDRGFYENLWATITAGQVWRGELVNKRKDDSLYHESLIIAPVPDRRGVIRHYVAIKEDISARKVLEARLIELARTDALTGLPNRRAFMEGLRHELERMRRGGHGPSVLMIDIDFFKRVNDQYGHAAGDKVLKAIATIVRDEVRSTDTLGRIGGEEVAGGARGSPHTIGLNA